MKRRGFWLASIIAVAALLPCSALAQSSVTSSTDYPTKPVRVVVGFAPGGAADIQARMVSQKLSESLGRSFVVENRAGPGGVVAYALVATSPPDGYTLVGATPSYTIAPAVYAKVPYDPMKDLTPISLVAQSPYLLVVHPSLPVKSVRDLIALAKAKPGVLNAASSGVGSTDHLALEYFNSVMGVKVTHIPYKGTGQGLIDLMAGRVHMLFGNIVSVSPHVKSKKLRALAVTSSKRSASMPELPTITEAGPSNYELSTWFGILGPRDTPSAIVNRLNVEITKIVKLPDVVERLARDGGEPVGSTPEQFTRLLATEMQRWRKIVRDADIHAE